MKKFYFLLLALSLFTCVNAQVVNIPDANFKAQLLSDSSSGVAKNLSGVYFKIDANNDGQIQVSEALQVSYLDVLNFTGSSIITSLSGISSFTNLKNLNCAQNQITTLDLRSLANLQTLDCSNNQLTSLSVKGLLMLQTFNCQVNQLTSLDLSGLTNLQSLDCSGNQLSSLNVNISTNLQSLKCSINQLSSLNVSGLTKLQSLDCSGNQLPLLDVSVLNNLQSLNCSYNKCTSLNVNGLVKLQTLDCSSNQITILDASSLTKLQSLNCSYNQLTSLFVKNGSNETTFNFSSCRNLQYICADDFQIAQVENKITQYAYTKCRVNSYCSFNPGGTYYVIRGSSKYDQNTDGCDAKDIAFSGLKFAITDGTNTGSFISNTTGNYLIPVLAGTHTINPILENPAYFIVSPITASFTFPTQTSPVTQNFCITANGIHPDLEITLLSINRARPGFDATYKLIYKNKGTNTQSGSVNLMFDDAVLDFVSANPIFTNQIINNLTWSFTNLLPFETREITFTLNVNSPMETPAVIGGTILAYNATITSAATDETPIDNTFAFNQTVVNSFDPNDKTCLEGTTISPDLIGQYVHYMIRFENNGTANAKNIVVKDMIDLSKFDISTLVPTNVSHSFVTNISAGNKVEFIFENINLPFDDANNDGYIAFKIKTLPTLVVGDSFTNEANIYFDYNFPILTNKATSTFKTLGNQDFEFSNYFNVYPNPVNSVLNISSKKDIEIKSVAVYDILGRLVLTIPNAQKASAVDVSNLKTGSYFIKINSDKGNTSTKFIKK